MVADRDKSSMLLVDSMLVIIVQKFTAYDSII